MNDLDKAKKQVETFLGGKEITFSIRNFPNGEWIAECNEMPAIMTGGMGDDITAMDMMIRDAIATAAGIKPELTKDAIKFTGLRNIGSKVSNLFKSEKKNRRNREAEYVIA